MTDERKVGETEYQLTIARALISKPENWIQNAYFVSTDRGVAYCASGALHKAATTQNPYQYYMRAYDILRTHMGGVILFFNDAPHRTHEEVLAAFDKAIAEARELGV